MNLVLDTKHLPERLATDGQVPLAPDTVAKLIGRVFIQRAAVNLLSSVLGTPEWFWREADSYQVRAAVVPSINHGWVWAWTPPGPPPT